MRFAVVLSLVLLSVNAQSVRGNSFKAIRGKVSDAAARWLPQVGRQAVALSLGVSLLFAPLTAVQAGRYTEVMERAAHLTNLQLKDEIEALEVGVTVDARGELVQSRTSLYADLRPSRESGERLRLLTTWNMLEIVGESSMFKRGAGIGHRIALLIRLSDENEATDRPELRQYLAKAWLDLAHNEFLRFRYLLKDEAVSRAVQLAKFPQEFSKTTSASRNTAAQKIEQALTRHHRLLNKLRQEKLSIEEYELLLITVQGEIASAVRESYAPAKKARYRALWGTSPRSRIHR